MKKLIFILLCSVGILNVDAQNIIRPKIAGPNGLFVNSYNGVLFFGQTDIETQNTAMPMQLRFYYNSSAKDTNYGYGLGFSLGYEMRYEIDSLNNVIIETGDGRTDTFTRFGEEFQSPAGVFSTLTYKEGVYTLTEKTGETYEFADANHKRLTAQTDRNGNRTTLTYSADSLLTQIQDAVGHTITLEYSNKLLSRATATFLNGSITYAYDAKKRLTKRTDAMGYTTVYDYDRENHLDEITDANGHKTNIFYNASGMVARMKTEVSDKSIRYDGDKTVFIDYTAPQNQYSYYRWDDKGRVIEKVGLCCGIQSKLEYDEDDNVIKRIDANGNATTYTYDDRGNMLSLTDPEGNTERYTYDDAFNQVTSFSDKNGNSYSFSYDAKGNMTNISGPEGFTKSFTYNERGWKITTTDANNNVTRITYNDNGTVSSILNAAGYTQSLEYDGIGNIISVTDGNGNSSNYKYDSNNRMIQQTDALGNSTILSYDKTGNIVRIKDASNHITAYTYNALNKVLSRTNANGDVIRFSYDGKGNIIKATNALGYDYTMTYNERNKMLSQTTPEGETTSYDYDRKGNLSTIFLPNGNTIYFDHDMSDRLIQVSDNMGIIYKFTYDANGNRLTVSDGLERTTSFAYDGLNRCISSALPNGADTKYAYDANGNLLSTIDALGNITTMTYSSLNQILTKVDALNAESSFEYDGNGNLIKMTDARGNSTVWAYNVLNRNTQISFANGSSLQNTYDVLGNVIESRDRAGQTTKYTYDATGRLLNKTYADNTRDEFYYDAEGQIIKAVNKNAVVLFEYDKAGRLLSETLNGKTTIYGYDLAEGIRTYTYPSGMKVEEHLNARDLIETIIQNGKEAVTMTYNLVGQKVSQAFANGVTTHYEYNENGWLSHIFDDSQILDFTMTYDALGNIVKRTDGIGKFQTETYGYDAISQLVSFNRGNTVESEYQFDHVGNRIKTVQNGISTNYTTNNVNSYSAVSGGLPLMPQYDDNGNLLTDGNNTISYDFNNRVISINDNVYKYDAIGRRISKNNNSYYYVSNQLVEEFVNDVYKKSYLYGNNIDETIQMVDAKNTYYFHADYLGSTKSVTDSKGDIVEYIMYDAYGMPEFYNSDSQRIENSLIDNSILFAGREFEDNTPFYYMRNRTYDCEIGRFIQHDPLQYVDGPNNYTYAQNNPVMMFDSFGLFCLKDRPLSNSISQYGDEKGWPAFKDYNPSCTYGERNCANRRHQHIIFPDGDHFGYGTDGMFGKLNGKYYINGNEVSKEYYESKQGDEYLMDQNGKYHTTECHSGNGDDQKMKKLLDDLIHSQQVRDKWNGKNYNAGSWNDPWVENIEMSIAPIPVFLYNTFVKKYDDHQNCQDFVRYVMEQYNKQ